MEVSEGVIHVVHGDHPGDAGVVDQNVQPAELGHDLLRHLGHLVILGHVHLVGGGSLAQGGCRFKHLFVLVREDDRGSLSGHHPGDALAVAHGGASDQGDFVL